MDINEIKDYLEKNKEQYAGKERKEVIATIMNEFKLSSPTIVVEALKLSKLVLKENSYTETNGSEEKKLAMLKAADRIGDELEKLNKNFVTFFKMMSDEKAENSEEKPKKEK